MRFYVACVRHGEGANIQGRPYLIEDEGTFEVDLSDVWCSLCPVDDRFQVAVRGVGSTPSEPPKMMYTSHTHEWPW